MRRVILADPGLRGNTGHEQAHARVLAAECAKRGLGFEVLASREADAGIVSELGAQKVFSMSVYAKPQSSGRVPALKAWRLWSRLYVEDFEQALDRLNIDWGDLIVLNTVTISVLDGFAESLVKRRLESRPAAAVILRLGAEEGLPGRTMPGLSRWLYRFSINKLFERLNGRLLLAADTRSIGSDFERLTRKPVAEIPLPIMIPPAIPPRATTNPARVVFPSSAYADKGFHLLPDALRTSLDRCPDLCATVRVANLPAYFASCVEALKAIAPRVRLVHGALTEDQFYAFLSEADAVLLPYDPVVFAKRSSQILAQSAALGRPVIVIAGSFLDRERQSAGTVGVAAEAFTADALAAAIERFVTCRSELAAAAWAACPAQRRRHSAVAFMDLLLEFAASCEGQVRLVSKQMV